MRICYGSGINYSKCCIPPCNPHLLSGKWDTFHQALLGRWTRPSPHWPICSWCIWCCMVKMHYRPTVLLWLLQPVRHVCNGLVKFCVAMNRQWLMSVLLVHRFPFAFSSFPCPFIFSFCICLSQRNICSLEGIREFQNNNLNGIIIISE